MEDSPDIEISHGTQGVAVECKCQGLGAGRKVPNELFRRLAGEVDRIDNVGKSEYGIVVEPFDRLEPSDIQPLVAALQSALREDCDLMTELALRGRYEVTARRLCVKGGRVPFAEAKRLLETAKPKRPGGVHFAVKSEAHLTEDVPEATPANPGFLICQSRERDHVLSDLMNLADGAAHRLPSDKPGVVAVHVSEHIDWGELGNESALDYAVTKTFGGTSKRHVSLIVFSAEDEDYPMGPRFVGALPYKVYANSNAAFPLPMSFIRPGDHSRAVQQTS